LIADIVQLARQYGRYGYPRSPSCSAEPAGWLVKSRGRPSSPASAGTRSCHSTIPHLTRSSLHRSLQLPEISRLPRVDGDTPGKRKFTAYPIGCFPIDIDEVRTEEGKLYLFVAIDRTSKLAFAALQEKADWPTAARFLKGLILAVPYRVHIVLTDNGLQFTDLPRIRKGQIARHRLHPFEELCRANGIEHRLTKPNHPWTEGQVERMRARRAGWSMKTVFPTPPLARIKSAFVKLIPEAAPKPIAKKPLLPKAPIRSRGGRRVGTPLPAYRILLGASARTANGSSDPRSGGYGRGPPRQPRSLRCNFKRATSMFEFRERADAFRKLRKYFEGKSPLHRGRLKYSSRPATSILLSLRAHRGS
jgi:transposase InsO family protein